ncbi:hypothetical protein A1O3_06586 [Capronia epimyces CBS 606.96]|uniref:Urea active transporter n=1 Tax=Capronia epimyces CBS 606.96 TaxID=1182542 RepID=W9Y0K4_9EURO|nr:uncharacterized protein A1O3_06586 [Capronia epimyces CBS 606.96]EXJ82771.1 hypothetical protein A1O3_06586 [Capronia epimyces CBS 606.96]
MSGSGGHVTLLSQGTGYGIIIGLSIFFCLFILAAIRIQKLYLQEDSEKSEMFMVANRTVGIGLTASAVFSSWMWLSETVFAVVVGYNYGIAAPMLYGGGLAIQISLMAVVGVVCKLKAPHAHTSLEIVRTRYGSIAHGVFTILNLINNIFGCSSIILAGSQLMTGITGVHLVAATILLPLGVVAYTAVGGLKATFLTDYVHTAVALILIIFFTLKVLTNEHIGGIGGLYDKVRAAEAAGTILPVPGNYAGSLLAFKSKGAIIFSTLIKLGNLGLVTMDTAFWQKSFASEVSATVPGYDLAALSIFAVPWGIGSVIGLSTRVLERLPIFPTYPNPMSAGQVGAGLPMVYTIYAVVGRGGVIAFLFLLFMALTSTVSSSMIAVSSIFSFDVYRTYLKPKATDRQIIRISHFGVFFYSLFISAFTLALSYGGANMLWWNYFAPMIICPGVVPLILTIFWKRQTALAATLSPILGMATGISIWLGLVKHEFGVVNMTTTSNQIFNLYGALGTIFSPLLYSVVISLTIKPTVFDWREFLRISLVQDDDTSKTDITATTETPTSTPTPTEHGVPVENLVDDKNPGEVQVVPSSILSGSQAVDEKQKQATPTVAAISLDDVTHPLDDASLRHLYRWLKIALGVFVSLVLITWVVWPMPLWRDYIFGKAFFSGWITVSIIWQFFALFSVVIFPVWDGRHALAKGYRGVRTHGFFRRH